MMQTQMGSSLRMMKRCTQQVNFFAGSCRLRDLGGGSSCPVGNLSGSGRWRGVRRVPPGCRGGVRLWNGCSQGVLCQCNLCGRASAAGPHPQHGGQFCVNNHRFGWSHLMLGRKQRARQDLALSRSLGHHRCTSPPPDGVCPEVKAE